MTEAPAWTDAARALADKVTANAPEWHEAVSRTPRHQLVPRWWQRIPNSPAQEWKLVCRKGDPTSSSTLPGLIVSMAHRLDVKPGQRVLDVGTGSGYSAGLFARRFGDEYVTSVDVDPYLVEAARTRLAEFGRTPRSEAVDATGELADAEYDRIMATVSVRPVPASWLRALRPEGRVVTTVARTAWSGCSLRTARGPEPRAVRRPWCTRVALAGSGMLWNVFAGGGRRTAGSLCTRCARNSPPRAAIC
ncbi:methyltransferase domain-containing protein [Streptomyces venezuelae]|uniref:methyltransferase domain-containing protein n=1 Tax=Streptomyces venezuelae TaxID=54571 RepID=UPI001CC25617|nr:methyltransferase domain-containing protein [Streptomyces venezuelae]